MSCVVGIEHKGHVIMAGDSISGTDSQCWVLSHNDAKVFSLNGMAVGVVGSARFGNLVKYGIGRCLEKKKKKPPTGKAQILSWLFNEFVPIVLEQAERHRLKLRQQDADDDDHDSGEMLLGIGGYLFHVCGDMSVESSLSGSAAIGMGAPFALGAMRHALFYRSHNTGSSRAELLKLLKESLEVAEHFCPAVRRPWAVVNA